MCEHLVISVLPVKRVRGDADSVIKEHLFSAIAHLILQISQFLLPTTLTLQLR